MEESVLECAVRAHGGTDNDLETLNLEPFDDDPVVVVRTNVGWFWLQTVSTLTRQCFHDSRQTS
jgi:hypothetical protein